MGRHVPFLKDREVVTSGCHGNKIPGSQETEVLQIWQKKKGKRTKNDMYAVFPVHTWLSSFDNEYGRLCQDPEILLISLDWLSLD